MNVCTAPIYRMKELNNLFIEMTSKICNQRCESCYIDFPISKKFKDFITIDKIKDSLNDLLQENLYCIYLTGAEPMMHPDFNSILRLCLKRCNVCICTNSSFLNEKKIRFLKKVEDESLNENNYQIFFQLSLTHWDELKNDKVKYRGNYRQTISALKILSRYGFNSILTIQNYYSLGTQEIIMNYKQIFSQNEITNTDIKINVSYPINNNGLIQASKKTDCMSGRVLAQNGVYACPFLSNDYRGRLGSSFKDYSKIMNAETDFCLTCSANNNTVFSIG